jgi:hypothetical protein
MPGNDTQGRNGAVFSARRPPAPSFAIVAWLLALVGPVAAHFLVSWIVPESHCGTWGLTCTFYKFLGIAGQWIAGAVVALQAMRRKEPQWLAVPALVVNLVGLLFILAFVVRVIFRV